MESVERPTTNFSHDPEGVELSVEFATKKFNPFRIGKHVYRSSAHCDVRLFKFNRSAIMRKLTDYFFAVFRDYLKIHKPPSIRFKKLILMIHSKSNPHNHRRQNRFYHS